MVVHLFLNNNKALDFLPINSIKNGGITLPLDHIQKVDIYLLKMVRHQCDLYANVSTKFAFNQVYSFDNIHQQAEHLLDQPQWHHAS